MSSLDNRLDDLNKELDNHVQKTNELKEFSTNGKFTWKMEGYQEHQKSSLQSNGMHFVESGMFYLGRCGYKFRLRAYLRGKSGSGRFVSVYCVLTSNKHDDVLKWPVKLSVKITIMDQDKRTKNISQNTKFTVKDSPFNKDPVLIGFENFLPLKVLEKSPYYAKDTIYFCATVKSV